VWPALLRSKVAVAHRSLILYEHVHTTHFPSGAIEKGNLRPTRRALRTLAGIAGFCQDGSFTPGDRVFVVLAHRAAPLGWHSPRPWQSCVGITYTLVTQSTARPSSLQRSIRAAQRVPSETPRVNGVHRKISLQQKDSAFTAPRQKSHCLHRREHRLYPGCQGTTLYKTRASFHPYNANAHQATHFAKRRCQGGTWNRKNCTKHRVDEADGSPARCIHGTCVRARASLIVKPAHKWGETSEKQLQYNKTQQKTTAARYQTVNTCGKLREHRRLLN